MSDTAVQFRIPRLYPLTDETLAGVSHAEQVRQLSAAGARFIQLREKRKPSREFAAAAVEAIETAREFGTKIIINDRVDVALLVGADGVHLGQDDLPPESARRLLGKAAIIGYSTHTLDQVQRALDLPIDYLAFGPIFPTSTKSDAEAVAGLEKLNQVREIVENLFPIVAIGGIGRGNLLLVLSSGADSAALISAILSEPNSIEHSFRELNDIAKTPT